MKPQTTLKEDEIQLFQEIIELGTDEEELIPEKVREEIAEKIKADLEKFGLNLNSGSSSTEIITSAILGYSKSGLRVTAEDLTEITDKSPGTIAREIANIREKLEPSIYDIVAKTREGYQLVINIPTPEIEDFLEKELEKLSGMNRRNTARILTEALVGKMLESKLTPIPKEELLAKGQLGTGKLNNDELRSGIREVKNALPSNWKLIHLDGGYILISKEDAENRDIEPKQILFYYLLTILRASKKDPAYIILEQLLTHERIDSKTTIEERGITMRNFTKGMLALKKWLKKEGFPFEIEITGKPKNLRVKDYKLFSIQS